MSVYGRRNLFETCGFKLHASSHWDPHPAVGLSALAFVFPTCTVTAIVACTVSVVHPLRGMTLFHVIVHSILNLLFIAVMLTCFFADYVYIRRCHRSYYGGLDTRVAGACFLIGLGDFSLRGPFWEVLLLFTIAVGAYSFSACSSSFEKWVFRHSLWHVVAGLIPTYGAWAHLPEGDLVYGQLWWFWIRSFAAYLVVVSVACGIFAILSAERKKALWDFGAQYADWKPVILEPTGESEPE